MNKKYLLPLILAVMTALASALLMGSDAFTAAPIAEQKERALMRSLALLMPEGSYDNDVLAEKLTVNEPVILGHRKAADVYLGYLKGEFSVAAIPVIAQNGYSGDIELMVGVRADGRITAVEVLGHKETPGLGDLIERRKGDWLLQFEGQQLNKVTQAEWSVKKDGGKFDQITGATITPRAVVSAVKKALKYFENHQELWQKQGWRMRTHEAEPAISARVGKKDE
ncbi:electron transport complex subunit RsxG [Marinicella rhabdoformis]|uniref:electron transport complex subunit RsxG n=1 Tax=Marinicella rhabdoformis TaxID=2580566 RepID=UPI0012AECA65|nr:electron transport complex subunit RsxG [Marinicella rhabdoformis]